MKLTAEMLVEVMPRLKPDDASAYLPLLQDALDEFDVSTGLRVAAFLAQLAHESTELRHWEELASGAEYEGRKDLGNFEPGDGVRFKGRGPIQLTGRANYRAAGKALGLDLENAPGMVALPSVGFRVAAWFWKVRGLNALADARDFQAITRRINGGLNGFDDRLRYYRKALSAVGLREAA